MMSSRHPRTVLMTNRGWVMVGTPTDPVVREAARECPRLQEGRE